MSVIVKDTGFVSDDWAQDYIPMSELAAAPKPALKSALSVDVPSDADPEFLTVFLNRIDMIRIDFPSFADGRGFTIARRLRLMGYKGHLRAKGHVISDQYAMARRSGFDDVEINAELAERQPQAQWLARADWQDNDYQALVRTKAS